MERFIDARLILKSIRPRPRSQWITFTLHVALLITLQAAVCAQTTYDTTWNSLKNYTVPEWYQDAKFGIYHHWGLYSVPGYGNEWYSRRMYDKNNEGPGGSFYDWHVANYGNPIVFGAKDFAPRFKAEKFNADEYIDIIIKSGAKFFSHMTSHHEAFLMYGTDLTRWNCVTMGPKKDVGRMLMNAARKRGLKFGINNHLAENNWFYQLNHHNRFDAVDTSLRDLYNDYNSSTDIYNTQPSKRWLALWYAMSKEMIDVFEPDYLYYDNGWGMHSDFEPYRRYLGAYQCNKGIALGRGTYGAPGVVLVYKSGGHNTNQFVTGGGVHDLERGNVDDIQSMTFQTEQPIGNNSWGYRNNETYKTSTTIIGYLLDAVSKNGVFCLSLPPKSDGTLDDQVKTILSEIGAWMKINGEGIYATRTCTTWGTSTPPLRFTRNKANNVIYIFDLEWPGNSARLTVNNFNSSLLDKTKISRITLLGNGETPLEWSQNATALSITMPSNKPTACKIAYGFKIYLNAQSTTPSAPSNLEVVAASNALVLTWVDNSSNETGYKIERKSGKDDWVEIASMEANSTTYSDTMPTPLAYTYRVRACNSTGNSAYSNEATPAGVAPPTAIMSVPELIAETRDFPNSLHSITTVANDNTIRFISPGMGKATFILYSFDGRVIARKTVAAAGGLNTLSWDELAHQSSSFCFLEMRINGQPKEVAGMVRLRMSD